jgi:hypothetical protein
MRIIGGPTKVRTTHATRTSVGSTFNQRAIPPQIPAMTRSSRDRYNRSPMTRTLRLEVDASRVDVDPELDPGVRRSKAR